MCGDFTVRVAVRSPSRSFDTGREVQARRCPREQVRRIGKSVRAEVVRTISSCCESKVRGTFAVTQRRTQITQLLVTGRRRTRLHRISVHAQLVKSFHPHMKTRVTKPRSNAGADRHCVFAPARGMLTRLAKGPKFDAHHRRSVLPPGGRAHRPAPIRLPDARVRLGPTASHTWS